MENIAPQILIQIMIYLQEKIRIGLRATADVLIYAATTHYPVSKRILYTLNLFCI
jgi:hypothetical protein